MGRGDELRAQIETPPIIGTTPRLFHLLPDELDLRDVDHLERVLMVADALLPRAESAAALDDLEWMAASHPEQWPVAARMVVKLARSKQALLERKGPLHLSVVVPMYGEHERILRPADHESGEGFIDRKIRQLEWLLGDRPNSSWELILVDDGCPHGSGHIANAWLAEHHPDAPARVLFLEEAIAEGLAPVADLKHTDESRKGGSIHLGIWSATRERRPGHVVIYTDADLSTHLGQSGLLVEALDEPGILVAAGSRRHPLSVVMKSAGRSARGRLFIYLWKKLLPELAYIDDTQCGFKAMRGGTARRLVESPLHERGFAFDIELLLRNEKTLGRCITAVPIAWIDSEAASTTTHLEPYLGMLQSVVELYRSQCPRRESSERFAAAIEALDEASWKKAVDDLGPPLEAFDPALDRVNTPLRPEALLEIAA